VIKKYLFTIFCFLTIQILPNNIIAQYNFNGYLRNELGLLVTQKPDFLFARNILQLDSGYRTTNLSLKTSFQLRQDLLDGNHFSPDWRLREAYLERIWSTTELRIGRQMIVWGRSDATQINDIITPFDVSEFLTQDFTDLRQGVTAINASYFRSSNQFQLIILPFFEKPRIYESGGPWDPLARSSIIYEPSDEPNANPKNIQFAIRYENRSSLKLDFDASMFHGFNRFPYLSKEVRINQLTNSFYLVANRDYKKSTIFMTSAEYRFNSLFAGVYEVSYWTKRYFDVIPSSLRNSNSPILDVIRDIQIYNEKEFLRSSPFIQSMIGFKSTISSYSYSVQYVSEFIPNHSNDMLQDSYFQFISLLLSWTSDDNNMQGRLLSRYQINGNDFWLNPDLNYSISDGIRLSIGLHYFGGPSPEEFYGNLSFNSYRKNSFTYLKLTTYW
jgi:hypothetical protein